MVVEQEKPEYLYILRKNYPVYCRIMKVGDLDSSKFSEGFKTQNFKPEYKVAVVCNIDGSFYFRGKKEQYRILNIKQKK